MSSKIVIIDGHPDADGARLCHALADAYTEGAVAAGHQVRRVRLADFDFPLLRTRQDFDAAPPPDEIAQAQETILWCDHLVIVHPLWLGTMPALLKGFWEHVLRPGFAFDPERVGWSVDRLGGRTARIVVTMGMPALVYRWYYGAHSLKSLERNILRFTGIRPIGESIYGMVEAVPAAKRERWLNQQRELGRRAR